MARIRQIDHPLVVHHLTQMRETTTPPSVFRAAVERLTFIVATEACRDLTVEPHTVTTPIAEHTGGRIGERVAVVPILRAGLGMVDPILRLYPDAEVWHVGLYRDEQTLEPIEYYQKLPAEDPPGVVFVVDPMLATGGSATAAIEVVKRWGTDGPARIKLLAIIAAPAGLEAVVSSHPDVEICVCAVDEKLNDQAYIVPGLGDAGDRIFNTLG